VVVIRTATPHTSRPWTCCVASGKRHRRQYTPAAATFGVTLRPRINLIPECSGWGKCDTYVALELHRTTSSTV